MINTTNVIPMDNHEQYNYFSSNESTQGIISTWKGYDIQVVEIKPGDTILLRLNDNVDLENAQGIIEMMNELYPECTTIPVNEWFLKGMTILRGAQSAGDSVNLALIDRPLEEEYPELFKDDYWYWQGGSK